MRPEAHAEAAGVPGWLRHVGALCLAIVALPALLVLSIFKPAFRSGLRRRLVAAPEQPPGTVWLHAASAGEATILARVAERLSGAHHTLYASFTSDNGCTMLRRRSPDVPCGLAPLDHPWLVDRALARIQPSVLILFETEIWPFLVAGAARRGIPVVILAARISDDSHANYRRMRRFIGPTFGRLGLVCARSREDAERFIGLGAHQERVYVTGDLKRVRPVEGLDVAPELLACLADVPLLIGGSTHAGEEEALLDALDACEAAGHRLALVIAPRHMDRCADVGALVRDRKRALHLRSRLRVGDEPLGPGEVLLLDSIGELSALYALASLAFVGGTLADIGGHNLLEPVQAGVAVCYGPHTRNVADTAAFVEANHAGYRVADASDLALRVVDLFGDRSVIEAAQLTQVLLNANTDSLDRSLSLLEGLGLVRAG